MVPLCDEAQVEAHFGLSDIELILMQDRCMDLETVLVSVQDRCMVCARRIIGLEIVLNAHDGTTR